MKEIQIHPAPQPGAPAPIAGRCRRERKCVARRTVRGATQGTKLLCMADKGKISRPTWTVCWLHAWKTWIDNPK